MQETQAGRQLVEVELAEDGSAARASMLQELVQFGAEADTGQVFAAAGLSAGDAHPDLPPQEGEGEVDELEETPEFLQETPEHDRLWFEQKPPKDFDF